MTGNWESHLAVTCMAAACAVKVQGLHGADEVEPGMKPSPYLPPVPLHRPRHLTYFSVALCLMVDLRALLGQSDAMRRD